MVETAVAAVVWITLVVSTLAVRKRSAGGLPRRAFWIVCAVAVLTITVGTIVDVSGVLLAVPVVALAAFVILRGGWWLGDTGLFLLLLGGGTAGAYLLAAVLDPDTGSFADQGALLLAVVGSLVSLVAIAWTLVRARVRRRATTPRPPA